MDFHSASRRVSLARPTPKTWQRYQRETRRPLHCLLFLLPLIIVYEAGAAWIVHGSGEERAMLAHSLIRELLAWFGLAGFWGPGVVLLLVLFVWHRIAKDRWRVRAWVLPLMVVESLVLTVPLLVFGALFSPGVGQAGPTWRAQLVAALGAGVYEELLFRLLLISGLAWLMAKQIGIREEIGVWIAAGLAAVVFAACHFVPIGWERFGWGSFGFRFLAGAYLGAIFVQRGLGISSGCHAAYNVVLVLGRGGMDG